MKAYESPKIVRLGSIADFTRADTGHGDFDSVAFTSGAATGFAFFGAGPTS